MERRAGSPGTRPAGRQLGELAVPVVLLFSFGHQPVAHLLVSFARQGEVA
jgi:hypothetical protein